MFTRCCMVVGSWPRTRLAFTMVLLAAAAAGLPARAQDAELEDAGNGRAKLEAQFKEMLDGATLVGHFTVTGRDSSEPREERYNLESVEQLPNGRWLFRSRIRYGDHDVTVPLPLPVEWAGDTPVIVVDNVQVPGLGTYSARVMFFDDHYAGYWSGGDHGGHLFGLVERAGDEDAPEEDAADEPSEDDQ